MLRAGVLCGVVAAAAASGLPPELQKLVDMPQDELAELLPKSPAAQMVPTLADPDTIPQGSSGKLPVVVGHGMGDSCFNPLSSGRITKLIGKHTGSYTKCIPTGKNLISDTVNGFLMNMDKSVDLFAEQIIADPQFANGFNCIGFSQGNSLCRGYIEKYNNPPVKSFVSVHGTLMGVSGMPQCNVSKSAICRGLAASLGDMAYNKLVQDTLFQADYFRAPKRTNSAAYKKRSQLAQWNGEGETSFNSTFKTNFLRTEKMTMVKALGDHMVFPNEGEWWGHFAEGSFTEVVKMRDTEYYKQDTFGLKTMDSQGRLAFNTTDGDHLQFSMEQLFWWVDHYFM
eukprot:TRINITY_DN865_c0_g1_i1.p2 TRINITY_DN865_c0_g1~~TRINITY_DN865_c0_g1_i1.p2  ORF type:complete len:340 (+),score=161.42 TRINITY_DN865_c0_g1_i1:76-1095(+)